MKINWILVTLMALQLAGLPARAQSTSPYTIAWSSTNSGGASSSGDYRLNAVLSTQGTDAASGGPYRLWNGPPLPILRNYLPAVLVGAPKPDLIGAFVVAPDKRDFKADEPVTITAIITNQGELASGSF